METFLALERTYLSWARTSLTLVGLGFALECAAAGHLGKPGASCQL
ncbi:MAG: DUF202 domain-containing protein, partial [Proteobacteria bacterium]|nr:DUF202 domain-containing protein [Pseudomonadota bacterium]